MNTLLIADDEQTFLDFMVRLLQKDHHLLIAHNWNEVLEKFEANVSRLNATILDVNMPGLSVDPFTIVEKLLKSNATVPMIIISGQDIVLRHEFLKMGVYQYHGKPIDMVDLKLTLSGALHYNRVLRKLENHEKNSRDETKFYQRLLNISEYDVQERIRSYDTTRRRTPVLIRAEAGSRPAMLAKIIAQTVDGKLFFSKVCSESLKNIIPHNIQSGDTLFLEGIDNLAVEEQSFLLGMLEEFDAEGVANPASDFRLIASTATTGDSKTPVIPQLTGLLERLAKVEYRIEPLRLRKHELREIVSLALDRLKKVTFSKVEALSDDLYDHFAEYGWPLNYDELFVIMKALLVTCPDAILREKHLHQLDFTNIVNTHYPTLDEMVDEHIKKALRLTLGNKSRAAKMLGITPKTLYARIKN
jgi:DNA-binding NtrC family response regulator